MSRVGIINILLIGGGTVIFIVATSGLVWSHNEAQNYTNRMRQSAAELTTQFRLLEKSTDHSILDDPDSPVSVQQKDAEDIRQTILKSRSAIDDLGEASTTIDEHFYIGISDANKRAPILHKESQILITQSRDALLHYEQTLNFLEAYVVSRHKVQAHIDLFNQQADLNIYSGRGEELRAVATDIRKESSKLSTQPSARELGELRETSVRIINRVADGFDMLALGIDTAIDSTIYQAAFAIETASMELDTLAQKSYGSVIQNSRAVKDIGELTEKVSPLEVAGASRL